MAILKPERTVRVLDTSPGPTIGSGLPPRRVQIEKGDARLVCDETEAREVYEALGRWLADGHG